MQHDGDLFFGLVILLSVNEVVGKQQQARNVPGIDRERRVERLQHFLAVAGFKGPREAALHVGVIGKYFQPRAEGVGGQFEIMFVQGKLTGGEKGFARRRIHFFGLLKAIFQNQLGFNVEQKQRLSQSDQFLAVLSRRRTASK